MLRLAYATLFVDPDAECRLFLNDLPLLEGPRPARMQWTEILDYWMVASNRLDLRIDAAPDVALTAELRLSLHGEDALVGPDKGLSLPIDMRQAGGGLWHPLDHDGTGVFTLTGEGSIHAAGVFGTHGPDFTTSLRPSRTLDPSDALALAASVLQTLAGGGIDAVLTLMRPRLADVVAALADDPDAVRAEYAEFLAEVAASEAKRRTVPALTARQYGPLVEVRCDGRPLLRTEDGTAETTAIFGWTADGVAILR